MVLSKPYQHQPSAIASYNYTDLAEGTGIVKYYGFQSETSAGVDYHLGTNQVYAGGGATLSSGYTSNANKKEADVDFDLSAFNAPQTIRGTVTVTGCITANSSGGYNGFTYVIFKLRKWDGTTETELASVQTPTAVSGSNTITEIINVQMAITKTHFKKGEILRLTAEIWGYVSAGGNGNYALGVDPQNRDGVHMSPSTDDPTSTTKLEVYIPYDIDL
jgi:hypothetical protein